MYDEQILYSKKGLKEKVKCLETKRETTQLFLKKIVVGINIYVQWNIKWNINVHLKCES